MNASEIGTEAGRVFEYNLPSSWIFRSQEDQNDFGIDGEIELKDKSGRAVGKNSIFKVQIKGEENSNYIKKGKFLSFTLKIERLKYYLEFKVPVILVVVEISSEKIFWLPITNSKELRCKAIELAENESIQIHLPVDNKIVRKRDDLTNKMFDAVIGCWNYLALKGVKESISRFPTVSPSSLKNTIEEIGDVLFRAYHQSLNNNFLDGKHNEVYQTAAEICNSGIVPAKDRFVALLYYLKAFNIAPFTNIKREMAEINFEACHLLIELARELKSRVYRLVAIGKSRTVGFKLQLDQLHAAHHSMNYFDQDSLEHIIFNNGVRESYRKSCMSLKKIIELCNRLTKDSQYHMLSDMFIDIYALILIFEGVHKSRGSKESIEFLRQWGKVMSLLVMRYLVITNDCIKIRQLYYLIAVQVNDGQCSIREAKNLILSALPELEDDLYKIENSILNRDDDRDFFDLTIEDQKSYFSDMAKNLGMDPEDPNSEYGYIVAMGLENYDPSSIMKNCESLFVHYRPAGMIAKSLQMHSAGGIHLLVCLKHGYAQGTGNSITKLYDNTGGPNQGFSFRRQFCDICSDCKPREKSWSWSLRWYIKAVNKNLAFLRKYSF